VNFLAHFHLAWPDPGLVAGALDGDFRKGRLQGQLPSALEKGIRLHRAIDAYTDDHPAVRNLRSRFPRHLRRYAGIVIDLAFDHYLSRHWHRYEDRELRDFNRQVLALLQSQADLLSGNARHMLARLQRHDLLNRYRDWPIITATAERIGARLRGDNPLAALDRDLDDLRPSIEAAFLAFYPDLQRFSGQRRPLRGFAHGDKSL